MSGGQPLALEVAVDVLKKRQEWLAKRIAMASAASLSAGSPDHDGTATRAHEPGVMIPPTAITIEVRAIQNALGPRLGAVRDAKTIEHEIEPLDGGHFDAYRCQSCQAWLLTRAPASVVRRHGGCVCPVCPVSGLIASLAQGTVMPGFNHRPDGDIAVPSNGVSISAKRQVNKGGFSGTSKRGGRPRRSLVDRRARDREKKRRQRGISAQAHPREDATASPAS
jgi:hypothetical protein